MPVERLTPERRRAMTRQALVEAAAEAFAAKGFFGASLEEIADAAGFTRGAIYSNFASKEDLLLAVLDHYLEAQIDAVGQALDDQVTHENVADVAVATAAWRAVTGSTASREALALELRLAAMRNPQVRERLLAAEIEGAERVAQLIERETQRRGAQLRLPAVDFALICQAVLSGMDRLAFLDEAHTERYHRLTEQLFVMLAEVMFIDPA